MYESPINLIQKELRIAHDNGILKAISEVGIDVDKDELIKALRYDREQYQKGYEDGFKEAYKNIITRINEVIREGDDYDN